MISFNKIAYIKWDRRTFMYGTLKQGFSNWGPETLQGIAWKCLGGK